jgi:hypothetical protein
MGFDSYTISSLGGRLLEYDSGFCTVRGFRIGLRTPAFGFRRLNHVLRVSGTASSDFRGRNVARDLACDLVLIDCHCG